MSKDFRELLVEASRHDTFGRFFKELQVGLKVVISFQASETHSSEPAETLDDVYAYTKWEVALRQINKPIDIPNVGAWSYLKNNLWAKKFDKPEFQRCMQGDFISVKEAQQVFEDVIEYAMSNGQLDSIDDIQVVDPDADLKRGGCGGCGGKKVEAQPITK